LSFKEIEEFWKEKKTMASGDQNGN